MQITGTVQHGNGDAGRLFRFPTANIYYFSGELEPGIYAGRVEVDRAVYDGVICYGVEEGKLEAHLFDFIGDLYGREIKVRVMDRVADLAPFESIEQMKAKIHADAKAARRLLKNLEPRT